MSEKTFLTHLLDLIFHVLRCQNCQNDENTDKVGYRVKTEKAISNEKGLIK